MIPDGSHERMEPPECNADDAWFCEVCGSVVADDGPAYCPACERERDEMNGIPSNGTAETKSVVFPKLTTLDGKPTCCLESGWDHLQCPLMRQAANGKTSCAWTGADTIQDETGYLRPCENCPIHKSP